MTVDNPMKMHRQIKELLDCEVSQVSTAPYHSQPLMVPKPGTNKKRFTVDVRSLNEATTTVGGPLPNIEYMMQMIGRRKPKLFAVMDFTPRYHQLPMATEERYLTAFITIFGLYEWCRVPMGLKGAPAHFQRLMVTVVLVNLIYIICEAYLDDIITYGGSDEEFLGNLHEVLVRFDKYKLTLSPKKFVFGKSEIDYVGRLVDQYGLSFSKKKRKQVFEIGLPQTQRDMKKFLGLANYF